MSNNERFIDDLKYLDRDIKTTSGINSKIEAMLIKLYGKSGRKYTNRSPFKILLNAFKELFKLNLFTVSESINERNILLAENKESVIGIASAHNFQANRGKSATGRLKLQILSTLVDESNATQLVIDNNAIVENAETQLQYIVNLRNDTLVVDYAYGANIEFDVIQGKRMESVYIGDGSNMQITEIESQSIISENYVKVFTESGLELKQYGLHREMQINEASCLVRNGFDGRVTIVFGTGNAGYVPKLGEKIIIQYIDSDGSDGNAKENTEFVAKQGFKINGSDFDISNHSKLTAKFDLLDGYSGDDIEAIRLNTGSQTTSSVISTPENVKSYFRQFQQFTVSDVWREPGTAVIHSLLVPNINQLSISKSYFDLVDSDFIVTDSDKHNMRLAIFNDKRNRLVSDIIFEDYELMKYAMLVFIKMHDINDYDSDFIAKVNSTISDVLLMNFCNSARHIKRSDITTKLKNVISEIDSVNVKFTTVSKIVNNVHDDTKKYIDNIGDINTRQNVVNDSITFDDEYIVPIIDKNHCHIFIEKYDADENTVKWIEA